MPKDRKIKEEINGRKENETKAVYFPKIVQYFLFVYSIFHMNYSIAKENVYT